MATINGTERRDVLGGTAGADVIDARGGNDYADGRGGADRVLGGAGEDKVVGGAGNDHVDGGAGTDAVFGGDGNDGVFGGAGDDWLEGGLGDDWLDGGAGIDRLRGREGDDRLVAGAGDEALGGEQDDVLMFVSTGVYREDSPDDGNDDPDAGGGTGPTARLVGGSGNDTVRLDVSGATVDGRAADVLLVFSDYGGGFGVSIQGDFYTKHVAWVETAETLAAAPDGPPLYFIGNTGDTASRAVSVTGTVRADYFAGGTDRETVDLGGGSDLAILNRGGDVVTLGDGADTLELNEGYQGFVSATVTDFDGAEDTLQVVGFDSGNLAVREVAGVGTYLEAAGECSVLLEDSYGTDGLWWV